MDTDSSVLINGPSKSRRIAPIIIFIGVLLVICAHVLYRAAQIKVEPVDAWSKKTVMIIRNSGRGNFWQSVSETMNLLDPEFGSALARVVNKTGTSPFELAENLLPEPVEILVLEKDETEDLKNLSLKYDFVLITKAIGPGVENIQAAEKAARDFASWYLPSRRYTKLNDGTVIAAQIADPENILIKSSFFQGHEIRFIREPGLSFDFAYTQNGGWLYFGTSRLALEQLIAKNDYKLPFNQLSRHCASPAPGIQIFFNPRIFTVEKRPNLLVLTSPLQSVIASIAPNTVKVRAENAVFNWDKCSIW